jgi:hypothetical protein
VGGPWPGVQWSFVSVPAGEPAPPVTPGCLRIGVTTTNDSSVIADRILARRDFAPLESFPVPRPRTRDLIAQWPLSAAQNTYPNSIPQPLQPFRVTGDGAQTYEITGVDVTGATVTDTVTVVTLVSSVEFVAVTAVNPSSGTVYTNTSPPSVLTGPGPFAAQPKTFTLAVRTVGIPSGTLWSVTVTGIDQDGAQTVQPFAGYGDGLSLFPNVKFTAVTGVTKAPYGAGTSTLSAVLDD